MPRVKLNELPDYAFHYKFVLGPRDINYGGHLGNDSLVSIIGTARANMFRSINLGEMDLGDGKAAIIMSDLVVNFKAESFMFDELSVDTHVGEISLTRFRLFHRIKKGDIVVALVETGLTSFDYSSRKITPIPSAFLNALAEKGIKQQNTATAKEITKG